jgi:hypothetical protein
MVKGTHVQIVQRFIDEKLGEGTFSKLTASGGERWLMPLPVGWYDLNILHAALTQASERLHRPIHDIACEIAAENARTDLTGVYKIFFKVLSVPSVLSQLPRLWRSYVRFGECVPVSNEPGHYVAEGQGLVEQYLDWASGCWRGFISTAVKMAGAREADIKIMPLPMLNGGARFKFDMHYSK